MKHGITGNPDKERRTIIYPRGMLSDKKLLAYDTAVRGLLQKHRIPKSKWSKHDAVNLVELYEDCPSDYAFCEYWTIPHTEWLSKYRAARDEMPMEDPLITEINHRMEKFIEDNSILQQLHVTAGFSTVPLSRSVLQTLLMSAMLIGASVATELSAKATD